MNKKITILGIESSCDETAVSIIQQENTQIKILSNIVSSQFDIHKEFGGVVPELAARAHVEKIDVIAKKAIKESNIKLNDIDAIAATAGPGLIVCLTVGLNFGKTLAASLSSCHMMTFLALAAKMKWPVIGYRDKAIATLGKNSKGQMSVVKLELNPKVEFSNKFIVDANEMKKVQDRAHRYCFIANSLSKEVRVLIN